MDRKEIYMDMLIGVLFFLGGMITFYLISRCLKPKPQQNHFIVENQRQEKLLPVLKTIENNLSMQMPKGEVIDMVVDVTDTVKMLYNEKTKGLNWSSFTITNIGSSPVYMSVNTWQKPESPIYPGENIDVDMKRRDAIKKIYLVCDKGKSSTVKIHAIR